MFKNLKLFIFLSLSIETVMASPNLLKINGANITSLVEAEKEQVLSRLWDSEEYIDATYEISEIEGMNSTDYVMMYILIQRGNLLARNSFYDRKLQSLIRTNQLSQNDWLKLYIAFGEQKSHPINKLLRAKEGTKSLLREIDRIIRASDHPTSEEIKEIIAFRPDLASYAQGQYQDTLRTFVFCRSERIHPCLMLVQDKRGDWARDTDGSIFARPVLAKSSRDLPAHVTNGNTPRGIHTMDSVMPLADQFSLFGAYRRVKLDFLPGNNQEEISKMMLPESQRDRYWWRYNSLARDNGRSLFRIHGTGRPNYDESTPYFPHRPSAGCITTREGTYPNVVYKDQRSILDAMMRSLDLVESYENEDLIKGLLYLIELNTKVGAVKLEELIELGIVTEEPNQTTDQQTDQQADQQTDDTVEPTPVQDPMDEIVIDSNINKTLVMPVKQDSESKIGFFASIRLWFTRLFS